MGVRRGLGRSCQFSGFILAIAIACTLAAMVASVSATASALDPAGTCDNLLTSPTSQGSIGYTGSQGVVPDPSVKAQHATVRQQVKVTDFGADPTGTADSAAAIVAALQHAKSLGGPTTIVFPRGHYQIYPENNAVRHLYISNTVGTTAAHRMKRIGILVEDMDDVIVDGGGSRLTFHGNQMQFASIRSTNVTFKDFSTNWVSPDLVDLTVIATGIVGGQGYRDIQVPDGTEYSISGGTATFLGEVSPTTGQRYWTLPPSIASQGHNQIRDLASGLTYRSSIPIWNGSTSVQTLRPGVIRVLYSSGSRPSGVDTVYQMRDTIRTTSASLIWESTNVDLTRLNLSYLHGFGIVGQLSTNISLDQIRFRTDPGSWTSTGSFADFVQMSSIAGSVQITNTLFDNPHDDPINVHGTYVQVTGINRAARRVTLRYMHHETAGFPQFYAGNQLQFVQRDTLLPDLAGLYGVVSVTGPTGVDTSQGLEEMTVTLDRDLPDNLSVNNFVAENMTYHPRVYIAGNTFTSVPTRGILLKTPKPALIERNRFEQNAMSSISISSDANGYYESSAVGCVMIRNNIFDRPTTADPVISIEPSSSTTVSGRTVYQNIHIKDNSFGVRPGTELLDARSVTGLRFTGNSVTHYRPTNPVDPATASTTALFDVRNSADVTFSNNTYKAGFNRRVNITGMSAGAITADDGVTVGADNVVPGPPPAQLTTDFSWVRQDASRWTAMGLSAVTLRSGVDGLWATQNAARNILLKTGGMSSMTVKVSGATVSQYEEAGLIVYTNDDNYVEVMRKHANGQPRLALVTESNGTPNENVQVAAPAQADIWLRLVRQGSTFTASYSTNGTDFQNIGNITNGTVDQTPRVGVLAAGASDSNTAFTFSEFVVDAAPQPFFSQVPDVPTLSAALGAAEWQGVSFGAEVSPLAWLTHTGESVLGASVSFPDRPAGTSVTVQVNDRATPPDPTGRYTVSLSPGPNVVQADTTDANGARQTYRWVIVSERPAQLPSIEEEEPTPTTTTLDAPESVVEGEAVELTATVAPAEATGQVQFMDGEAPLGDPVTLSGGVATLTTSALTTGDHSISASYLGDTNFEPSDSAARTLTITPVGIPVITSVTPPAVTGTPVVGQTLSASTGSWSVVDVDLAYQWFAAGTAIAGATGPELGVTSDLVGKAVHVRVTASKAGHESATVPSALTATVAKAASVVTLTLKPKKTTTTNKRITVTVRVAAAGISQLTGKIKVTVGKKKVTAKMAASSNGKIKVKLPKLKKGTAKIKVVYVPTNASKLAINQGKSTAKIKVKQA